jgi:hypothetical protein
VFFFLVSIGGWYNLAAGLLACLNFPIQLPLGDLVKHSNEDEKDENGGNHV